mmetsp:Transcript_24264/g.55033  ORF Transcript_24264/g.55033 Transcript_24264/m.55033 type:complete len:375 (-) Transcript_24264:33-1157(-)
MMKDRWVVNAIAAGVVFVSVSYSLFVGGVTFYDPNVSSTLRSPAIIMAAGVLALATILLSKTQLSRPLIPVPVEACANCGKESGDAVELKVCAPRRLVKYFGVVCQRARRKHTAELKEERLFTKGCQERPEEDFCPICTLPIPMPMDNHSGFYLCCMKRVCHGCVVATATRGTRFNVDCPFCRTPAPIMEVFISSSELAMVQKRVDSKDPEALRFLGDKYYFGRHGLEKDVPRAIELWSEAAELGSLEAHNRLAEFYLGDEIGVTADGVARNFSKAVRHWEEAAIRGHVESRHNLGVRECGEGNHERAVKHLLISAKMGDKSSLDVIKDMFVGGVASKDQYADALKGYQEAMEEMKSPERVEAKKRMKDMESWR